MINHTPPIDTHPERWETHAISKSVYLIFSATSPCNIVTTVKKAIPIMVSRSQTPRISEMEICMSVAEMEYSIILNEFVPSSSISWMYEPRCTL